MRENYDEMPHEYEEYDEPIDWAKYIGAFLKYWKKIALVTVVFAALSVVIALCQKREYSVSVTLAPEVQGSSRGGSSLGSLASMFGVNLGSSSTSPDAFNITIFPEIVHSTPFLTQLFDVELSPKPSLPKDMAEAKRILNGPLPKVYLYDHLTKRDKEKGAIASLIESLFGAKEEDPDYMSVNQSLLTKEQSIALTSLRNMISANVDKKTAMTTIVVKMDDPLMCTQLADTVCRRLREYVFDYRTKKERNNFDYYQSLCDSTYKTMVAAQAAYAEAVDNDHSVILQKVSVRRQRLEQEATIASQVYQQMVQQREMSRAQLQEMKPVFAVVEPATMPQKPMNSRRKTCMSITFFGFVLACAWYVIGKDWVSENLPLLKEKIKA